jgi:S-DNA-T family DNA segregation ATPase FtsK/SpoIIIE
MLRHLLITGVVGGVLFSAFLLVVGVGVWVSPGGWTWDEWWGFVGDIADAVGTAFMVALQVAVFSVVPMWVYLAWRFGRDAGLPTWAMAPDQRDEATSIVTPAGVAAALAHLNIAPLNKAIKNGWEVAFHTPPVRVNNRGYQVVFDLPMGVTAEMIADKRTVLARNLHRAEIEVWPAEAERAGFVDLWVADPGANSKSAPAYPLLNSGTADVFAGIPLGVSLRGDLISVALFAVNVVFGGLMGQGKSNAARVMMLGAAVDPLAELWVFVFAGNGDFDAYQPRLARYHRGTGDDVAAAALAALQELYVEVDRRERRLAELGAKKVTRGLVEMHPDLRPVVALFSECHELFGHEDFGKQAADFAVQTLRRARKTGITLAFDTQSSRADAIPPKIVELVQINACFAVKTWRSNDGFLGDGSFQAGIRATELRAGKDRGTSVLTGATAERFEIVKWHFIEVDDDTGFDAATDVIARAMTKVHPAVPVGGTTGAPAVQPAEVDHLADIADALQSEAKVRTQVVLARLAEADRGTYESWTFSDLAGELDKVGIGARKSNGVMFVFAQDVREAITDRDHDESEESGT